MWHLYQAQGQARWYLCLNQICHMAHLVRPRSRPCHVPHRLGHGPSLIYHGLALCLGGLAKPWPQINLPQLSHSLGHLLQAQNQASYVVHKLSHNLGLNCTTPRFSPNLSHPMWHLGQALTQSTYSKPIIKYLMWHYASWPNGT